MTELNNNNNFISILKSQKGILSLLGLMKPESKEVLRIYEDHIYYDSFLGCLGRIDKNDILSIELHNIYNYEVIKIKLNDNFDISTKLNKLKLKMVELYMKEYQAQIVLFPQHIDWEIKKLYEELINKLNWKTNAH